MKHFQRLSYGQGGEDGVNDGLPADRLNNQPLIDFYDMQGKKEVEAFFSCLILVVYIYLFILLYFFKNTIGNFLLQNEFR